MLAKSLLAILLAYWPVLIPITLAAVLTSNYFNRGLNKYPGPILASFTNLWRFWAVYKRRPEAVHIKLHANYGNVVRLGPNDLSFSDPRALKTIYGLNKGFIKSGFYPVQQSIANGHRLPSLFSTTSESSHAQLRRCVSGAFSMSTLIQYEPFVDSTTELFISQTEKLYANSGKVCDFSKWLQYYAFDVIGEMTYSKRHGFIEKNKDIDGIIEYLGKLFDYVAPVGQLPFLDLLLLKNPIYLKAAQYGLVDATFPVARFAKDRMAERYPVDTTKTVLPSIESKFSTQPDLLSKFMQAKELHPDFMNDTLVTTMAVSMAFAGSETTAISLSAIFYFLLKNPDCLAALYQELDMKSENGHFANTATGLVTWAESQDLPYLDACIKESFRLHPAPGLPIERIVPEKGAKIAGVWVPGGTIVGCNAWVLHRHPETFGEDVEAFRPERWLVGNGYAGQGFIDVDEKVDREAEGKRVSKMGATMLHFGMGSRTCIGKNISLLEIYKLVPTVLRRFEVSLADPTKEWTIHNAWFVRQLNFNTLFRKRDIVQPIFGNI